MTRQLSVLVLSTLSQNYCVEKPQEQLAAEVILNGHIVLPGKKQNKTACCIYSVIKQNCQNLPSRRKHMEDNIQKEHLSIQEKMCPVL